MQQDFRNHVARFADFRWSFPVLFAILLYQSVYHFIAQFFCFGKICTGFFVFLLIVSGSIPSIRYAAAAFGSKEIAFSNASIASLCCPTRRCTEPFSTQPGTPESEQRLRDFVGYQLTSKLLESAKPDVTGCCTACPPTGVEEISSAVFEQHAPEIFDEAENRLHVQKAVLAILLAGK